MIKNNKKTIIGVVLGIVLGALGVLGVKPDPKGVEVGEKVGAEVQKKLEEKQVDAGAPVVLQPQN